MFDKLKNIDKTITLTLNSDTILVFGSATILCWDDTLEEVEMTPFEVPLEGITDDKTLAKAILDNANDSGFGCKKILSVDVNIRVEYEDGHGGSIRRFVGDMIINSDKYKCSVS